MKYANLIQSINLIKINGSNCLILVSCTAEAKFKASHLNGLYVGQYPIEDFKILVIKTIKH